MSTDSSTPVVVVQAAPAAHAHGFWYWVLVGWWWAPAKWVGRVLLWLALLPVGVWRSFANHSRKRELRQRRGVKRAAG